MVNRNIRILTWFNFFTDFKLYAPVAIIYFTHVSGSFALGMSVFSVAMISSALFEIPTGIFSDFIGRRKTVFLGAVSAVLYSILYALGQSYWMLIAGAIVEGLSRSFYSGNNDALLHDTLAETKSEHRFDEYLGKVSAMFQVALAVSAILGGILASWSFPLIMWLSVLPQVLCAFLSVFLIEPRVHTEESGNIFSHFHNALKNFLTNRKLRLLSLSSIIGYGLGESSYQFQSAFYNTLWPLWAIGIAKTLSNVGAALSFHFSGKLIKKFDSMKILVADNLFNRVMNITAAAFPSVLSPILMSSTSIFYGVTTVARGALMQKEFTNKERATMGSLDSFAGSIFFGVVAFSVGLVADRLSPSRAFLILQIFMFANLFVYWRLFKKK